MKVFTPLFVLLSLLMFSCETEECVKCYEVKNADGFQPEVTELGTRCGCEIHEFKAGEWYDGDIKMKRYCDTP